MSRILRNPKTLAVLVLVFGLFFLGLIGGALGKEFGAGFLGAPLAHIQLSAEPVTSKPVFTNLPVLGDFIITNTMVATWATVIILSMLSFLGTRQVKEVPGRLQSLLEIILEFFLNLATSVAGPEKARRFFPLVTTIFLFVVIANWIGILPGFGTIGRFEPAEEVIHHAEDVAKKTDSHIDKKQISLQLFDVAGGIAYLPLGSVGTEINGSNYKQVTGNNQHAGLLVPFLRSANTDVNTTLALALVAMFAVHWWGFSTLGFLSHMGKFINIRTGFMGMFVGILEGISEIARLISFTFRLFGNIFAGEVLLIAIAFLVPLIGLVPFLGLELFVGLIQAFIFSMLTLVFAATATSSHSEADH